MTDKRYVQFEFPYDDFAVKDNKTNEELWNPKVVDRLNEQEEKNMQLRNQIKIFELFLDGNNLDIEWDLFCTNEDRCPFTDASCQECIYLGINGDVDD